MPKLLHLIVSPRLERSHSRALSSFLVDTWTQKFPDVSVTVRDLRETLIPHVTEEFIAAMFTPPHLQTSEQQELLTLSNILTAELQEADVLVIGTPLYNQGTPSALSAWVDSVVRVGLTFEVKTDNGEVKPLPRLVPGKRAFVIVVSGGSGYETGGALTEINTLEPKLRYSLGFIGLHDIQFIYAGGETLGGLPEQLERARTQIEELVAAG